MTIARSGLKFHDRVTVSFLGDSSWLVTNSANRGSPVTLRIEQPGGGWATLVVNTDHVKRVRMSEPVALGSVVQTDEGRAVRFRDHSFLGRRWYLPDAGDGVIQSRSWGDLENPRPVDNQ